MAEERYFIENPGDHVTSASEIRRCLLSPFEIRFFCCINEAPICYSIPSSRIIQASGIM